MNFLTEHHHHVLLLSFAAKKGPIYDAAWAPNSIQFCVVFGFMPAKACIFDLKCNPVFEFGPTPKNACYFNPQVLARIGFA